jgi:chromosomal replication initiation ATPase DnaA
VTVDAILSGERLRDTLRARHEWWRLVRDTWDLSYPQTGRLVGGVDHTTILNALREREVVARKVVARAQVVKNKDANHTRKTSPNRPVGTL